MKRWFQLSALLVWAVAACAADPTSGPVPGLDGGRVRWVIPASPGGGYDTFMRLLAPHYEARLGVRLACENVTESGGLVAALKLHEAAPDGRTLGILNGTVLLTRRLAGEAGVPNLAKDYTLLARVDRSSHVWVAGPRSGIRSMDDVFRVARERPLVLGLREVGASSFASFVIGADLLGLRYELVSGFSGSREVVLSAIRGEVDLLSFNFESVVKDLEAGDLRALLQVSDRPIADHPALKDIPLLAGSNGLAAVTARAQGRDADAAARRALALAGLVGAGRLLVAPPGLAPPQAEALRRALHDTLADPAFRAAAARQQVELDVADAVTARAELEAVEQQFEDFRPLLERAIRRVRQ